MKRSLLIGFGNIGKEILNQIPDDKVSIKKILKTDGMFDLSLKKICDKSDWKDNVSDIELVFIALPSIGKGETAFEYEKFFLEKNIPVITCEKSSIAYNFDFLKKYKDIFLYTASVGGGTGMLKIISDYSLEKISEISGVVNGTLNYIADSLKKGRTKDEVIKEVLEKGFAEPGYEKFEDIVASELIDVCLKTVIIANYSGIFDRVISFDDVELASDFDDKKRCAISITKEKITAGFIENTDSPWLPDGVNNILKINNQQVCIGPGAGPKATVESMMADLNNLI